MQPATPLCEGKPASLVLQTHLLLDAPHPSPGGQLPLRTSVTHPPQSCHGSDSLCFLHALRTSRLCGAPRPRGPHSRIGVPLSNRRTELSCRAQGPAPLSLIPNLPAAGAAELQLFIQPDRRQAPQRRPPQGNRGEFTATRTTLIRPFAPGPPHYGHSLLPP